jgi:hypothetical protein
MSEENVEIVRRASEAFAVEQEPRSSLTTPDFIWDMSSFRRMV